MSGLVFDPALGWPLVWAVAAMGALAAAFALWRGLRGWALRALAAAVAALALAGPAIERAERAGLSDIVILLDDLSASQSLGDRPAQTQAAVAALEAQIAARPATELRRISLGDDDAGTLLGGALAQALAAEPESRIAGVIAITDGRLHDAAALPATAPAPVHVLLSGQPGDWDRRLVIEDAPAFGLIGEPLTIRLRVEDQGAVPPTIAARSARLHVSVDGEKPQMMQLAPGVPLDVPVVPKHAGQNVVSLSIDPAEGQMTDRNDAAALTITGVRDRLRVLLVSGEPHPGERTWRNLLKSDAAVDLIHFTILRPPEKMDGVPVDEMSLIAFPVQELFMERIRDFDLIIFDRYKVRGILPPEYFENIRNYVEEGGAVLVSAGDELATVESLALSPLGPILPATPTGQVIDRPFLPRLTEGGLRHPVTSGLAGAPQEGGESWGRWLRQVAMTPKPHAQVVMSGADDQPLLILSRQGKGRVALIGSDQVWLWARGFEGGGPQLELLRRIAHWSMKEPELEEEALLAEANGLTLTVTRRSMNEIVGPLRIDGPTGRAELALSETTPGRFTARWSAPEPGLYRLSDGDITRVVVLGPAAPKELEETVASGAALSPLAKATGGAVLNLSDGLPSLRDSDPGRRAFGRGVTGDWIGVTPRHAASVTGLRLTPLLPDWGWLALFSGLMLAGWMAEGRRLRL